MKSENFTPLNGAKDDDIAHYLRKKKEENKALKKLLAALENAKKSAQKTE